MDLSLYSIFHKPILKTINMKKISTLFFMLFLLFVINSNAKTFGGFDMDHGYELIRTSDNGYALLGKYSFMGSDIYIIKLDSAANLEWFKKYGNTGSDEFAGSIVQTVDGGYLVIGTHGIIPGSGPLQGWLLRLNSSGDTLWSKTYPAAPGGFDAGSYVGIKNINEYVIGIDSQGLTAANFLFLCHTDSSGNVTDTISMSTIYGKVLEKPNGFLMTATNSSLSPGSLNLFGIDTTNGSTFDKSYYDSNFAKSIEGNASALCGTGFLTVGSTNLYSPAANIYEYYVIRTDSAGDSLWAKHWGTNRSSFNYILQDNDLNYLVSASIDSSTTRKDYICKMDSLGNILWNKFVGNNLTISSIVLSNDNGFAVIGDSINPSNGTTDVWFMIYDSLGNPVLNPGTGFINHLSKPEIGIKIYPNPADEILNIDFGKNYPEMHGYNFQIDNAIGKTLYSKSISNQYYTVNLNSWIGNEIYFLNVINESGKCVNTYKILKR
jgi:hypothetical protein